MIILITLICTGVFVLIILDLYLAAFTLSLWREQETHPDQDGRV